MNPNKRKKHHFLYYIFQQDKKRCIMKKEKAGLLAQWFKNTMDLFKKGDIPNE